MGILEFFASISRNAELAESIYKDYWQVIPSSEALFIDFNSIVYTAEKQVTPKINTFYNLCISNLINIREKTGGDVKWSGPVFTGFYQEYGLPQIPQGLSDIDELTRLFINHFTPNFLDQLMIEKTIEIL